METPNPPEKKNFRWDKARLNKNGNLVLITLDEIMEEWPLWDDQEKFALIDAYRHIKKLGKEEFKIFDYLMENAEPSLLCFLADRFDELPDRRKALGYIIRQIDSTDLEAVKRDTDCEITGTIECYYRAVGFLCNPDDHMTISFLKKKIAEMMVHPDFYKGDDSSRNLAYVCVMALEALCRIEPEAQYVKLLRGFANHPDKEISSLAQLYSNDFM